MIDRYDAPEGMVAVRHQNECDGCIFDNKPPCKGECSAEYRKDREDVIFRTRADFVAMLKQEIAQFYGFEKDNVVILIRHKDKHS